MTKIWMIFGLLVGGIAVSGCAPLVIAGAGAAAVVVADEVAENDGDEGLF